MRPPDYCLLGRRQSGVVTDGLQLWLDARDAFTVTGSSKDLGGIIGYTAVTFLDRVAGTEIQISAATGANGDGVFFYTEADGGFAVYSVTVYARYFVSSINSTILAKTVEGVWKSDYIVTGDNSPIYGVKTSKGLHYCLGNSTNSGIAHADYCDGLPHHYVFQINAGNAEIYVDGNLIKTTQTSVDNLSINGAIKGGIAQGNKGKIIDYACYRCYNRPLSESEIQKNYNYEKSLGRVT